MGYMQEVGVVTPQEAQAVEQSLAVAKVLIAREQALPDALAALRRVSCASNIEQLQNLIAAVARIVADTEKSMPGVDDVEWDATINALDDAHDLLDAVQPHRYKSSPQSDRLSQVLRDIERGAK